MNFLHEEVKLVHTDLKPENILFEKNETAQTTDISKMPINVIQKRKFEQIENNRGQSSSSFVYKYPLDLKVKIIDFGGATFLDEAHDGTINTRQYRSPEVILRCCKWDNKCDVWSLGCIFAELYTGDLLFPTHDDLEHLALIQKNSGKR
jgi:dual-specificity kinase